MQRPVQITLRDFGPSAALETHIRGKAAKLDKLYPHITGCKVTVEIPARHKHQGKLFNVRIDLHVPGSELVINRELDEDVYLALRNAFDAAKRQLDEYGEKQRGGTKQHEMTWRQKSRAGLTGEEG
jgi:ribosomal subunit interface protein